MKIPTLTSFSCCWAETRGSAWTEIFENQARNSPNMYPNGSCWRQTESDHDHFDSFGTAVFEHCHRWSLIDLLWSAPYSRPPWTASVVFLPFCWNERMKWIHNNGYTCYLTLVSCQRPTRTNRWNKLEYSASDTRVACSTVCSCAAPTLGTRTRPLTDEESCTWRTCQRNCFNLSGFACSSRSCTPLICNHSTSMWLFARQSRSWDWWQCQRALRRQLDSDCRLPYAWYRCRWPIRGQ